MRNVRNVRGVHRGLWVEMGDMGDMGGDMVIMKGIRKSSSRSKSSTMSDKVEMNGVRVHCARAAGALTSVQRDGEGREGWLAMSYSTAGRAMAVMGS
jgi:hypothetical protein